MAISTFFMTKNIQSRWKILTGFEKNVEIPKNGGFMKTENFKDPADQLQNDSKISGHVIWSSYLVFQYKASKFRSKIFNFKITNFGEKIAIFERIFFSLFCISIV